MVDGIVITKSNVEYKKQSGVYAIINKTNEKLYIGSAVDIYNRIFCQHIKRLNLNKHENINLQRAWLKYGEDVFYFKILERCYLDVILLREQIWIDKFDFDKELYNLCPIAGNPGGRKHSEESKKKMSLSKQNISDETKKKLSESSRGRKHSDETRKKISLTKQNLSEETKRKMSLAHRNISDETRKKMSLAKRNMSNETRKKMSIAQRNMSYATREKISSSRKRVVIQLDEGYNLINFYTSAADAERKTGVKVSNISHCCNGKRRIAGGYHWLFEEDCLIV